MLSDLEASTTLELLQQHENSIVLHKHSSFLAHNSKSKRDLLEAKIYLSFDVSQKHEFSARTLRGIKR